MVDLKLDKYLNITNKKKIELGLEDYAPLYPMVRIIDNKLYIGVMITNMNDNVWDANEKVKAEYYCLIDPKTDEIIEFNKTSDKDYIIGDVIDKKINNKQVELSKYIVNKKLEYKNYLLNDIRDNKLLFIQDKVSKVLDNTLLIDGEKVSIDDYLISNLDEDINTKIDELVDLLVQSKYGSITFYYDTLLDNVIKNYNENKKIDIEKINLLIEMIDNYYDGVIGISNFVNIK